MLCASLSLSLSLHSLSMRLFFLGAASLYIPVSALLGGLKKKNQFYFCLFALWQMFLWLFSFFDFSSSPVPLKKKRNQVSVCFSKINFVFPIQVLCDNVGEIYLEQNHDVKRTKHIDTRYHFIRNVIDYGKVVV